MLLPKRVKYRRVQRGRLKGKATRGNTITYGDFGLVATEPAWITSNQIEAARIAMTRYTKRGFNNIFAKPLEIINLSALNAFNDGDTVTAQVLLDKGILSKCPYGYKVLGNGKITKKLTVEASAFSKSAQEAIEAAGGKAEVR